MNKNKKLWDKGTYIVRLALSNKLNIGDICIVQSAINNEVTTNIDQRFLKSYFKPFVTLEKAKEYSKRIKNLNGEGFFTKKEGLDENKVYTATEPGNLYVKYILNKNGFYLDIRPVLNKSFDFTISDYTFTEASKEDTEWFNACVKTGKYIEKDFIARDEIPLEDLVEGKYYFGQYYNKDIIFNPNTSELFKEGTYYNDNVFNLIKDIIKATPEEKRWLQICEQENTFVSLEDSKNINLESEVSYYSCKISKESDIKVMFNKLDLIDFKALESYSNGNWDVTVNCTYAPDSIMISKSTKEEIGHFLEHGTLTTFNQFRNTVIHVKTQKEWDFVTRKLNYEWNHINEYDTFLDIAIDALTNTFCSVTYALRNSHKIISFQEWLDKTGYKMESKYRFNKGDYHVLLEHVNKNPHGMLLNYIYKLRETGNEFLPYVDCEGSNANGYLGEVLKSMKTRPATKQEIVKYEELGKPYCIDEYELECTNSNGYRIVFWEYNCKQSCDNCDFYQLVKKSNISSKGLAISKQLCEDADNIISISCEKPVFSIKNHKKKKTRKKSVYFKTELLINKNNKKNGKLRKIS